MQYPDQFDDDDPAELPAGLDAPDQTIEGADESLEPRLVQQVVSVRLGASSESIFVQRTEMLEAAPLLNEPGGDLWDEHARALGMSRPRPRPGGLLAEAEPASRPQQPRPRRPGGKPVPDGRGQTAFISFGSKSRLPARMTRSQLDAYLKQERDIALAARDPLAITYAAERYNLIMAAVRALPDGELLDLLRPVLSVAQVSKILDYNTKEVRRLLGQGKISGRKVGGEWRIPLRAVL